MEFIKKTKKELKSMSQEEINQYFFEYRKYLSENNLDSQGINLRKFIAPLMTLGLKLNRKFNNQTLEIISDDREKTDRGKIYCVNHIGRYDIEISREVINESSYIFMGDPNEVYLRGEKYFLDLNGVVFLDTNNKEDRKIAKLTSNRILEKKGNITIFPEGAWNITENEVIMKLYTGAVDMAMDTNSDIIPIALEQYDKRYYAKVGKNIKIDKNNNKDSKELTLELRDIMATLRYEIWEKIGITKRSDLPSNMKEIYLDSIMKDSDNGYTIEEIERTRFHDKNIASYDDVFENIDKIVLKKNNNYEEILKQRGKIK